MNFELPVKSTIAELQSHIGEAEKNYALWDEPHFDQRMETIDLLEFHVLDQIEELQRTVHSDELRWLKHRAGKIKSALEEINTSLFKKIREQIRTGIRGAAFKKMIGAYTDIDLSYRDHMEDPRYDNLDALIDGIFPFQPMPEQTLDPEPEMVYYQKTPARILFELEEKLPVNMEDVFVDLGSGLGQPALLFHLLTGIKVIGVELDPAFCAYAANNVKALDLTNVEFVHGDARMADYSTGTIFFMFTPFKGKILEQVLEKLKTESRQRKIKLFTYGPCTTEVARQKWLKNADPDKTDIYKLTAFSGL